MTKPRMASSLNESPKVSHTVELAESWLRERPDINHDELLLQIYVMRLGRVVEAAFDRICRADYGISGAETRVLFALRRAGPPFARRPTDLFRTLLMTSGAITKQVDRLQAAGLVVREVDPSHAGGFLVTLTDRGKTIADEAVEMLAGRSLIAEATKHLTPQRLKQAVRLYEKLLVALEPDQSIEMQSGRKSL